MILLNYSHPITLEQMARLEALVGQPLEVRTIFTQPDMQRPFAEQAMELADMAGLSPEVWQSTPLLVIPPSLCLAATALLAELHGRMGYFPSLVHLRLVTDAVPPRYEIAEVIDLQGLRNEARKRRSG